VNSYSALPSMFRPVKRRPGGQNLGSSDKSGKVPAAQLPLLPEPHHIDAYRAALYEFWRLMALGPNADPDPCRRALNEVFKGEDEVGEPRASELRGRWEVEWHQATGRCPRCGERGERHGEGGR
jgi:hypothetical protein